MKLCMLTTRHQPNDDRIYYKQVLSLATKYSDITLIAPDSPGAEPDAQNGIHFDPLPPRKGIIGRIRLIADAIGAVRRLEPDVCHFHDYDLIAAVPFLKLFTKAKLVYDAHEAYSDMARISEKIPRFLRSFAAICVEFAEKRAARRCSLLITADDATGQSFQDKGMPTVTIFNYPRLELFNENPCLDRQLREKYEGSKVLIYQGSMGEDRGLSKMIEALPLLKQADESYLLMLVGLNNAALREKAESYAKQLDVFENLEVISWVKHVEIASYIRIALVGLVPLQPVEKYKKNIPIKLFEYMACGVPVLAADLPPIRPYVSESGAGMLYDSTSAEAMADGVQQMTVAMDRWQQMSEQGRKFVQSKWNWDCMEQRLLEAYAQLDTRSAV